MFDTTDIIADLFYRCYACVYAMWVILTIFYYISK